MAGLGDAAGRPHDGESRTPPVPGRRKLHGRAFYESLGSPKMILAPMVDQSEFAWRLLTRSFIARDRQRELLAYTPMLHSRLFVETSKFRSHNFQPTRSALPSPPDEYQQSQGPPADLYLDGNPLHDRPLVVQFCANNPDELLEAARYVQPFCDAVDLNLGCPQGIAKRGHYGAFLQEEQDLVHALISRLHEELAVPVTAKIRVLESREKTLEYARLVVDAGASILTVHGRQREQKGHKTGMADWSVIRHLRERLPADTVLFANGNVLTHEDLARCLEVTGADGVMSAEGNLCDPAIFAAPPAIGAEGREYWRGRDGRGGYRMDAVLRRYLDIIYEHVLEQAVPVRKPLFIPGDPPEVVATVEPEADGEDEHPPRKKQRRSKADRPTSPNLLAMQAHLFHLLRPLVAQHTPIRDALARCRAGDLPAFEAVLRLVEGVTRDGMLEYERGAPTSEVPAEERVEATDGEESSAATAAACRRPFWVCQPYVRPLPGEALAKGSLTLGKKERARLAEERAVDDGKRAGDAASEVEVEGQVVAVEAMGRAVEAKGRVVEAKGRAVEANGRVVDAEVRAQAQSAGVAAL
ncbi:MAG: hypothetical protein M1832_004378 [Thelocarpon impressellum]|nr:MAG: hypothetical protein M1832_004378 [Thelocarpon impressellum]